MPPSMITLSRSTNSGMSLPMAILLGILPGAEVQPDVRPDAAVPADHNAIVHDALQVGLLWRNTRPNACALQRQAEGMGYLSLGFLGPGAVGAVLSAYPPACSILPNFEPVIAASPLPVHPSLDVTDSVPADVGVTAKVFPLAPTSRLDVDVLLVPDDLADRLAERSVRIAMAVARPSAMILPILPTVLAGLRPLGPGLAFTMPGVLELPVVHEGSWPVAVPVAVVLLVHLAAARPLLGRVTSSEPHVRVPTRREKGRGPSRDWPCRLQSTVGRLAWPGRRRRLLIKVLKAVLPPYPGVPIRAQTWVAGRIQVAGGLALMKICVAAARLR